MEGFVQPFGSLHSGEIHKCITQIAPVPTAPPQISHHTDENCNATTPQISKSNTNLLQT